MSGPWEGELAFRAVVLVGFMGAGKSTVGAALADRLEWRFVDSDETVERRADCTIEEIFAVQGESRFREIEEQVMRELLRGEHVVIASGGGWAAHPGRLDGLDPAVLSVWLQVSHGVALERLGQDTTPRPLLSGEDATERAAALLQDRLRHYGRADVHFDSEGMSPEELAVTIAAIVTGESELPGARTMDRNPPHG